MNKKNQIIEVVPYNSNWILEFKVEASRIRPLFSENFIAIHHIGSTAVPGLPAKPIIDIILEVSNIYVVDVCNDAMARLGYEAWSEHGISGRRFFLKRVASRIVRKYTLRNSHAVTTS